MNEWQKFSERARVSQDEAWGALREYMQETDLEGVSLLFSSEGFCTLDDEGISFIFDFCASHEIIPIFAQRDPEDWRRSMREQKIKKGQYIPEPKGPAPDLDAPKIARWSDAFSLKVVPYSPACSQEVLALLGNDENELDPVKRENVQFSKSLLDFLNSLNASSLTEGNRPVLNRKIMEWAAKNCA